MTASARERAALVETLKKVGPDAPTLCGGWTTRDLAAHLVLRERRLDAAAGILVPALAGYTERVQHQLATSTDWTALVDMIASGPPLYSPFKLLDPFVNTGEMFIHHEDVRRAGPQWEPRNLDDGTVAALRRMVPMMSRMTLADAPARVVLCDRGGATVATVGRGPEVVVTGAPPELLLFASGRDAVRADFAGDPDTVATLRGARRGL
ncbi:MAG TPA: TIGR03085 family metal-binding protein [Mycobacterium sp.]|nr:TIGR03085 family metal-binding protein [Mycobacterium sp.]